MIGPLVLPQDVEIVPVSSFSSDVREQIQSNDNAYAVTRPRSRFPSKIIDAQAAQLLREFQEPTTLVEAIVRFSRTSKRRPTEVLEEAFPFLESLLLSRLLVAPGAEAEPIRPSCETGDEITNCVVQECIQVLNDTELYRVRLEGRHAALKISRAGAEPSVKRALAREASILQRLNGRIAPQFLLSGELEDGRTYLVCEWIPGRRSGEAASAMRAQARQPFPTPLLALCSQIMRAYAALQNLGVVHSDVHANNILVMDDGTVRIIDHGYSRIDGTDIELNRVPRGGVPFFFEPGCAQAVLSDAEPPLASFATDQYSVAALIYFLLSGRHYLDFAFGKEAMLRQIVSNEPVPLSARKLPATPAMDAVFARAFAKNPSERFPNMMAMAEALERATSDLHESQQSSRSRQAAASPISRTEHERLRSWVDSTVNSLSDPTSDLAKYGYPTASLTYGAVGIAYGLFRIACTRDDPKMYALAVRWLDRARSESQLDSGFYDGLEITPEIVGHTSPYHASPGLACVEALITHAGGDLRTRATAVERFLRLSRNNCEEPDLTLGKSGTLLALSSLVDAFRWETQHETEPLLGAGNELFVGLWEQLDAMSPISDSRSRAYLGIAHGWAGYLYASLRWIRSAQVSAPVNLRLRLRELADCALKHGRGVSWPCQTGADNVKVGGWCNGSAGFVFLWSLAYRLFPESEWLSLAEGAAWDAFDRQGEDISLCCGLAGRAYSQLNLFRQSGNHEWLDNAKTMAANAVRLAELHKSRADQIPFSLYKGGLGLAVLVAELDESSWSSMPFFEHDVWPEHDLKN